MPDRWCHCNDAPTPSLHDSSMGPVVQNENIGRQDCREIVHGLSYKHEWDLAFHFSICPKQHLHSLIASHIANKKQVVFLRQLCQKWIGIVGQHTHIVWHEVWYYMIG